MGELFNIAILLAGRLSGDNRRTVADRLLRTARPWIGEPHEIAVHYTTVPDLRVTPWVGSMASLPDVLALDVRVHIYTGGRQERRGVLTVGQGATLSAFTISVPIVELRAESLGRAESVTFDMYDWMTSLGYLAFICAGSELELDVDATTLDEAVRKALNDTSILVYGIGPVAVLPRRLRRGLVAVRDRDRMTVRHRDAMERWPGKRD